MRKVMPERKASKAKGDHWVIKASLDVKEGWGHVDQKASRGHLALLASLDLRDSRVTKERLAIMADQVQ